MHVKYIQKGSLAVDADAMDTAMQNGIVSKGSHALLMTCDCTRGQVVGKE